MNTRREFIRGAMALAVAASARPLSAADEPPRSLPAYDGPWVPLFNGRDLDGWTFYQDGVGTEDDANAVVVEDGVIHILGPRYRGNQRPGFGHIASTAEHGDYHLQLEYRFGERHYEPRLLAKRNTGILYHMYPDTDRVWPNSVEFQLEESDVGDAILINARCWPGADVGGTPAWPKQIPIDPRPEFPPPQDPRPALERQRVKKNGDFEQRMDWNTIEILAVGDQAAHLVNGRIVATLYELVVQDAVDRDAYRPLTKGRIALEIEAAEVSFRNIRIRRLARE